MPRISPNDLAVKYRDKSYSMPDGRKWDKMAIAFGSSQREKKMEKNLIRPGLLTQA